MSRYVVSHLELLLQALLLHGTWTCSPQALPAAAGGEWKVYIQVMQFGKRWIRTSLRDRELELFIDCLKWAPLMNKHHFAICCNLDSQLLV